MDNGNRMGRDSHTSHHHSGSHHRNQRTDESEIFKMHSLTSQRRRKLISKVLMIVLSILAVLVIVACVLVSVM